ncbi:acyl-CoA dehydrogenase [Burkholderia sp. Se-20373]|uniref:acyl-CoA dehydrogenase family protein n=1 Tax=Burkholderia TaxID=32008 RepID=UPI000F5F46B8|nr:MULTISPECIES: acyl-CoA dehydrogenase family protein [Burkholderia]MBN3745763.1 acyl-CoA dehydrogenase [Burkholderia sp. Se-20373]RQT22601.1 acyl-CoA dehydrogenase [Burkholderia cepacia]
MMRNPVPSSSDLVPPTWTVSDDQRALVTACQRFAQDQLEPLLAAPPSQADWRDIVTHASSLDLGTMILPTSLGGMAIGQHDLCGIVSTLACGPIERAVQLTQSIPALMTLRAYHALDALAPHPIGDYFNGTCVIALTVPDFHTATLWHLHDQDCTPVAPLMIAPHACGLGLIDSTQASADARRRCLVALGTLSLEQWRCKGTLQAAALASIDQCDAQSDSPAQTWLTDIALYLSALLNGAMQHDVAFALRYGAERRAFRKPIMLHQRVATRLADMLIATQGTHLFLRALTLAEPNISIALVRQLIRHIAAESVELTHELVQFCGAHGYVSGLPPAARLTTCHWFAMLLMRVDTALGQLTARHTFDSTTGAST